MNRKLYRAALGLALATAAAGTMPVMAENTGKTYAPVAGGSATFEKYLIMKDNAEVPNVTFSFTAAPAENVINANKDAGTLKVYKGVGNPTIADVTFAQGQETWTEAQKLPDISVQKEADGEDNLTLGAGEKYARKDVTVDLSKINFNEPGVYRYVITEAANDTNKNNGILNDADATRILDVYVEDTGAGALKVAGYVLQNGEPDGTVLKNGDGVAEKSKGFANKYTTNDLTISKTVTGNQASRDEYFKLTVTLSGTAGNVYNVDLTNADATTKTNAINTVAHDNPSSITVEANGSVTKDFWLQGGQSIVIKGITANASYTVAEDPATVDAEAYTPTAAVTGDEAKKDSTKIAMDTTSYAVTDDALTKDTTVAFTNDKNGTIPTGIIMSVAPYAAIVLLGGAGATIVMRKKKEEDAE